MLATGATAIRGVREKSIMAAGRGVRVVVTILRDRIRTGIIVMHLRSRGGFLVVAIIVPILGEKSRWRDEQGKRAQSGNKRTQDVLTHGLLPPQ
jgi:hypothetical protein